MRYTNHHQKYDEICFFFFFFFILELEFSISPVLVTTLPAASALLTGGAEVKESCRGLVEL